MTDLGFWDLVRVGLLFFGLWLIVLAMVRSLGRAWRDD